MPASEAQPIVYSFVQYNKVLRPILHTKELSTTDKCVLCAIDQFSQGDNWCWASNQYLAQQNNISVRGIQQVLQKLETMGLIERRSHGPKHEMRSRLSELSEQQLILITKTQFLNNKYTKKQDTDNENDESDHEVGLHGKEVDYVAGLRGKEADHVAGLHSNHVAGLRSNSKKNINSDQAGNDKIEVGGVASIRVEYKSKNLILDLGEDQVAKHQDPSYTDQEQEIIRAIKRFYQTFCSNYPDASKGTFVLNPKRDHQECEAICRLINPAKFSYTLEQDIYPCMEWLVSGFSQNSNFWISKFQGFKQAALNYKTGGCQFDKIFQAFALERKRWGFTQPPDDPDDLSPEEGWRHPHHAPLCRRVGEAIGLFLNHPDKSKEYAIDVPAAFWEYFGGKLPDGSPVPLHRLLDDYVFDFLKNKLPSLTNYTLSLKSILPGNFLFTDFLQVASHRWSINLRKGEEGQDEAFREGYRQMRLEAAQNGQGSVRGDVVPVPQSVETIVPEYKPVRRINTREEV